MMLIQTRSAYPVAAANSLDDKFSSPSPKKINKATKQFVLAKKPYHLFEDVNIHNQNDDV
jgi:hypothetical protein